MNLKVKIFFTLFFCFGLATVHVSADERYTGSGNIIPADIHQDQPFYDCFPNTTSISYNQLKIETSNAKLHATSGAIVVLLPAQYTHIGDHSSSDGLPDDGYDLAAIATNANNVSCPQNTSDFTFSAPQIIAAGDSGFNQDGQYYHQIRCDFSSVDPQGSSLTFSTDNPNGNPLIIKQLINPTCAGNNQQAKIFAYLKLNNPANQHLLSVASINQEVNMHASIAKRFSFTIGGVASGKHLCGFTTDQTSLANKLNFGTVTAKKFSQAAHQLTIDTNTPGFAIVLTSDDQMRQQSTPGATVCPGDGSSSDICLPNAQVPGMSTQNSAVWNNHTASGLGYTQELAQADDAQVLRFDYLNGYRHFPDSSNAQAPALILHTLTGTYSDSYLCYRLVAKPTNLNGIYRNQLTYSAYPLF